MNLPNEVDDLFDYARGTLNLDTPDTICPNCRSYVVRALGEIVRLLRRMPPGVTA